MEANRTMRGFLVILLMLTLVLILYVEAPVVQPSGIVAGGLLTVVALVAVLLAGGGAPRRARFGACGFALGVAILTVLFHLDQWLNGVGAASSADAFTFLPLWELLFGIAGMLMGVLVDYAEEVVARDDVIEPDARGFQVELLANPDDGPTTDPAAALRPPPPIA